MTPNATQIPDAVREEFGWLADNFVKEVPGVTHVLVVSADGLKVAKSSELHDNTADQFASLVAMMLSIAKASAGLFGRGGFQYSDIVMGDSFIVFQQISEQSGVAVLADEGNGGQLETVCFELAKFVNQSRRVLNPSTRAGQG
jgi:predicted regulator of Ras-like GTPase activity (Roadblock/LC7/MglB family)